MVAGGFIIDLSGMKAVSTLIEVSYEYQATAFIGSESIVIWIVMKTEFTKPVLMAQLLHTEREIGRKGNLEHIYSILGEGIMSKESKKSLNWILLIANLIVVAATFLPWTTSGGGILGDVSNDTLFNKGSGFLFLILAALNILFTLLRKRIPTYIITGCILALAGVQISASASEFAYWFGSAFGLGFYVMLIGIVLSIVSHPIVIFIDKKNGKR